MTYEQARKKRANMKKRHNVKRFVHEGREYSITVDEEMCRLGTEVCKDFPAHDGDIWWINGDFPVLAVREPDLDAKLWILRLPDGTCGGIVNVRKETTQAILDEVCKAMESANGYPRQDN